MSLNLHEGLHWAEVDANDLGLGMSIGILDCPDARSCTKVKYPSRISILGT